MKKVRRILSIMVCLTMILGMIPGTAFAETGTSADQIGLYYEVNNSTGAIPGGTSLAEGSTLQHYDKTGPVSSGGAVQVDKTIAGTDTENVFDITLKVSTTEKFDQNVESADAATVLVIDCSGSMKGNRIKSAKEAAVKFVNGFSTDMEGVQRKIAVVAFSGYDKEKIHGAYIAKGWTNAANASEINSKINGLKAEGGTNIEAGLYLANYLLSSSEVSKISNKNVILLSDGVPTYGVGDREDVTSSGLSDGIVCYEGRNQDGDGNDDHIYCAEHGNVDNLGQTIAGKANTYAVYVGGSNDMIDCDQCSLDKKVTQWLSSDCGFSTYNTSDLDELIDIFEGILRIIEMKAEAWIVTDPMGPEVDFVQFNRSAQPENEFNYSDGSITWDIKSGSIPTESTVDGKTVYTYTLSYRVKLDNLNKSYVADKYYRTNGVTGLTYLIEETQNDETKYYDGTAYFNIPSVTDYAGSISFTKMGRTDSGSLAPLTGAKFQLNHADSCGCGYTHSGWTVTSGDDGNVSFANIPSGHKYVLTEKSAPEGYKISSGRYVFKVSYGTVVPVENTLIKDGVVKNEQVIDIPVEKVWNDGNGSSRPGSITVNLLADGKVAATKTITAADGWKYTFEDQLKFTEQGKLIDYTITEEAIDSYAAAISGDVTDYVIVNTLLTDVSGSKTWDDEDNQDGIRPQTIVVNLLADGKVVDTKNVTEADGWAWTFADRSVYDADGSKISYTVTENAVTGYKTTVDGYNITNKHVPETVNVSVKKVWNDGGNQDGIRPASASIQLYSKIGDVKMAVGYPVEISSAGSGKHTFTDLPRFAKDKDGNRHEVEYTVSEAGVPAGYTVSYDTDETTGELLVINTHETATVDVSGAKTWVDNDNRDGARPDSITIRLLANGNAVTGKVLTVTAADNWAWSFTGLPANDAGKAIAYTVSEDMVDDYYASYDGMNVTNTNAPDETAVTVNKVWDDADNQDGIRPDSVKLQLKADGEPYGEAIDLSGSWKYTWEHLPKYKEGAQGVEIKYTVSEEAVEGYKAAYKTDEKTGIITITNTHEPETVDVKGSKTWVDNNNQDGMRPEYITINLLADGQVKEVKKVTAKDGWAWEFTGLAKYADGAEIDYTITEDPVTNYKTEVKDYNVTNTHEPFKTSVSVTKVWADGDNQDGIRPGGIDVRLMANGEFSGKTVTLNESNGWTVTLGGLDKYAGGKEIAYTFEEIAVKGYETSYSVNKAKALTTITNTHTPDTTTVSGTKSWSDANDQDGARPESITVKLLADGKIVEGKSATVGEAEKWSYSFTGLPKYKAGKEIVYTVAEFKVDGYSTDYKGMDVANKHTPEETSVTVNKVWNDEEDQDGVRPDSIQMQLLADGEEYGKPVTVKADDWSHTWTMLPKYADGKEIVYTVSEAAVEGYEKPVITKDTDTGVITVTNTHKPETVVVEGSKTWIDNNNLYETRPDDIKIILLADGVEADHEYVLGEGGEWTWRFEDLPKYKNKGVEIVYSIKEEAVPGYSSDVDGYDVMNTLAPGETEVSVTKVWNDADNRDGMRPEGITAKLLANGKDTGKTVTLNEDNNWTATVADIPEYDENCTLIQYSFEELAVEGYESAITGDMTGGYTITNTHEIQMTYIKGSKIWNDADDQDGMRPESITVNLLANGTVIDMAVVTAENGWAWNFEDLPVYEEGKVGAAINYTVSEEAVPGYTAEVNGYNITNTHEIQLTDIEGSKTWDDADDQDGMRPESITVNLLANGEVVDTAVVTAANGWAWNFKDMPVYETGKVGAVIDYTVEEVDVEGYESAVSGYDITNTHKIQLTDVEGSKTWDDNNDEKGIRPESITINLLADGEVIDTAVVTAEDDWAWSFKDLPVFKEGEVGNAIAYTIEEEPVEDYNTVVNGYNVVNKVKASATAGLDGIKTFNGGQLQAGMFEFTLADAQGRVIETVTHDANGFFSFTEFVFDAAGTYSYQISEVIPEDALLLETGVYYKDGIIYLAAVYNYTVTVVENEDGDFEVESAVLTDQNGAAAETVTFINEDASGFDEGGGDGDTNHEEGDKDDPSDKDGSLNNTGSDKSNKDSAAQTGDEFSMTYFALLAAAALTMIIAVFRRKETAE